MFLHQLEVFGKVLKSHGYQGDLIISVEGILPPDFEMPDTVFIVVDGIPVPFFTEYYEIISDNSVKIKFDTLHSREETLRYYNCDLMAEKNFLSKYFPRTRTLNLISFTVFNERNQKIGQITEFSNIPGNPVVTVETENGSVMLPVSDELIVSVNEKKKNIVLKIPEGLLEKK